MGWHRWSVGVAVVALGCGPVVGDEGGGGSTGEPDETSGTGGDPSTTATTNVDEATSDPLPKYDIGTPSADLSGAYLFAVAAVIDPMHPLQWIANVTHDTSTDLLRIQLQSLSLDVGSTNAPREPVGEPLELQAGLGEDGSFGIETPEITIVGAANPITGGDLTVSFVVEGTVYGRELWCGEIFGQVTQPIGLDLTGSTFGVEPIGDVLPDPVLSRCPD